jgi:hypothetical protein
MDLIENAFELYLSRIAPPSTEMKAAQRSHNALRDFLLADDYFGPMIVATFLNGSYARNTVIRPIKDVDIIVVTAEDWLKDSPAVAMECLRRKLAQRYDQRRTLRQRRAVRVTLYDMQLDVLIAAAANGGQGPLRIPDRHLDKWIVTHPKAQLALTSELGGATRGNYSRLVRLLKAWSISRVAARDRPSSFVLECAGYHAMRERPSVFVGSIRDAFLTLLEELHRWNFGRPAWFPWGRPEVPDPALPDVNVAERWEMGSVDRFRNRLEVALRHCADVQRSRWDETEVEKWQRIFGQPFPGPESTRRLRAATHSASR